MQGLFEGLQSCKSLCLTKGTTGKGLKGVGCAVLGRGAKPLSFGCC